MQITHDPTTELAILSRVVEPDKPTFTAAVANHILKLGFPESDKTRMGQLSTKANEGTLTPDEQNELDRYELIGHLLNLLQSKARCSLKGVKGRNSKPKTH